MNLRSPATSFVAALDEPWRFLRTHFSEWAPCAFALAGLGLVPGILIQWLSGRVASPAPGGMPDFASLLALGPALVLLLLASVATQLGAFVIVTRVLDGERPRVGDVLLTAFSPRVLLVGGLPFLFILMGFGCIVGGPIAAGLIGFAPAAAIARPGAWFSTWGEAFTRASVRASPRDAGAPGLKLAVIALVYYGILSVVTQPGSIPALGWMAWVTIDGLGSGDILGAIQTSVPFPIAAAGVVLGMMFQPFSDIFLAAGVVLLWRDLERVREGADLEVLVGGTAT